MLPLPCVHVRFYPVSLCVKAAVLPGSDVNCVFWEGGLEAKDCIHI